MQYNNLKITKIGFPSIMADNDIQYLTHIFKVIEINDKNAEIVVTKSNDVYCISVLPSSTKIRKEIIEDIKKAHFLIGVEIEFSKSLNISTYVTWYIK